jgi:hypothetical protein
VTGNHAWGFFQEALADPLQALFQSVQDAHDANTTPGGHDTVVNFLTDPHHGHFIIG